MHSYSGGVAALAIMCGLAAGSVRAAEPEVNASLLYQDNVSRADRAADRESDLFARAAVGLQTGAPVGLRGSLWAGGNAGADAAFSFDDLSRAHLGGELGGSYKIGLGPRAPRLEMVVPLEHAWFGDADRNRWLVQPTVRLRKRLSEAFELEAFIRHEVAEASTRLFDAEGQEGGLLVRWRGEGAWSLLAGYGLRDGDVVAYATPPRPDLVAEADVIVADLNTFDDPRNGYRVEARTQRVHLGAGFALDEQSMLEAGYEWQDTRAGDLQYDDHLVHLGWRRAF